MRTLATIAGSLVLACTACRSSMPELPPGWAMGDAARSRHRGPLVASGEVGPARFVTALLGGFEPERAMELARFADGYYREPANEGYEAVLDRILADLRALGFGGDPRLELSVLEGSPVSAWTPRGARLSVVRGDHELEVLHRFGSSDDRDRTMLPRNAPSARVSGTPVFELEQAGPGRILVTERPLGEVLKAATDAGVEAVLSSYLEPFNVDPQGRGRHLDAIRYGRVPRGTTTPVAHVSPRTYAHIRDLRRGTSLAFEADVQLAERPLRTVVATFVGDRHPDEVVAIASHVQEPGACDNASGVAGLLEAARALYEQLEASQLPWPARSLSLVWGDEFAGSERFLEVNERRVVAAFSADMLGESPDTGAICLLERPPDPGALTVLPPDEHTPWGAGQVDAADIEPNGLALITRCALVDVATAVGGWDTGEHPWEGGSDHDVFLALGIPAALVWHFTDFAYHTSLDRLEHLDAEELERASVSLFAAALAVCDPRPTDLDRYLESLKFERRLRLSAAEKAGDVEVARQWNEWFTGARLWLRALCLDLQPGES